MASASSSTRLARAGAPLRGDLHVPGDKSVSHRAIMLAAIAEGISRHRRLPRRRRHARDGARFCARWACASKPPARAAHRAWRRPATACAPSHALDCGNAGTGMRLLAGLLAGQAFDSDAGRRCVAVEAADAARHRAAGAHGRAHRRRTTVSPPLRIAGGEAPARHRLRTAGRQRAGEVRACCWRACMREGRNRSARTASHARLHRAHAARRSAGRSSSRRASRACGRASPARHAMSTCRRISRRPRSSSSPRRWCRARTLVLRRVGMNPRRTGLLRRAAARWARDIVERSARAAGRRSRSPISSCATRRCMASRCRGALVPDMIDEFPALFVAAALRRGRRPSCAAPPSCGSRNPTASRRWPPACARSASTIDETPGRRASTAAALGGGSVDSHGDHRIAMALAVAAQRAKGEVASATAPTSRPRSPDSSSWRRWRG